MHVDAELGDFVCVDNHCTVAHHVELADGVNFRLRAMGSVKCGETTFVGAGAVLIQNRNWRENGCWCRCRSREMHRVM